jgi:cell division protein FtsL
MMALGMLLVLPFFLSASLRAKLHQYRTEVVDLEAHIKQLDEQRQRLDIEFSSASNLERIEKLAREVSSLVEAEENQVVYLARTPVVPARNLTFLAEATEETDGRRRP